MFAPGEHASATFVQESLVTEGETAQPQPSRELEAMLRWRGHALPQGQDSMGRNSCWMSSNGKNRKDFKISGQIAEANQKYKITFTSLEHQIENGLRKEYLEMEKQRL